MKCHWKKCAAKWNMRRLEIDYHNNNNTKKERKS